MKKFGFAAGIAVFAVTSLSFLAKSEAIQEGKWTMTMVTRMAGIENVMEEMADMTEEEKAMMQQMMGNMGLNMMMGEDGAGITTTVTKCLTNDDPVPDVTAEKNCQTTHKMMGNTMSFESTCPDSHSTGEVTYEDNAMHGLIQSHSSEGDATIELSGAYEGPCE